MDEKKIRDLLEKNRYESMDDVDKFSDFFGTVFKIINESYNSGFEIKEMIYNRKFEQQVKESLKNGLGKQTEKGIILQLCKDTNVLLT